MLLAVRRPSQLAAGELVREFLDRPGRRLVQKRIQAWVAEDLEQLGGDVETARGILDGDRGWGGWFANFEAFILEREE